MGIKISNLGFTRRHVHILSTFQSSVKRKNHRHIRLTMLKKPTCGLDDSVLERYQSPLLNDFDGVPSAGGETLQPNHPEVRPGHGRGCWVDGSLGAVCH